MAQEQAGATYELGMQQTAATEALGMKKVSSAYDIGMAGSTADYEAAIKGAGITVAYKTHERQQDIMDKFYRQMAEFGDPNVKVLNEEDYAEAYDKLDFWYEEG